MKLITILYTSLICFLFAVLSGCSSTNEQPIVMKSLFPDRHGWDLKQVSISDTESTLDFKRVNCVWVVGSDNQPSDEPQVTALAEKLLSVSTGGPVAIEGVRFGDYKVADENFTRKVVLTFKDKSSFTLLVGIPTKSKSTYIRLSNKEQVYRIDSPFLKQINLDSDFWLAPKEG